MRRTFTARKKTIEEFENHIFEKFQARVDSMETPFDVFARLVCKEITSPWRVARIC